MGPGLAALDRPARAQDVPRERRALSYQIPHILLKKCWRISQSMKRRDRMGASNLDKSKEHKKYYSYSSILSYNNEN